MTEWIKWLGELVWRIVHRPSAVKSDENEQNFWYRLYGAVTLLLSMLLGLLLVVRLPAPLSRLVSAVTSFVGADKPLSQAYVAAALVLVLGIPLVIAATLIVAGLILVVAIVALAISGGVTALVLAWVLRTFMKRPPALLGGFLGFLVGAAVVDTVTNPNAPGTKLPWQQKKPQPPATPPP